MKRFQHNDRFSVLPSNALSDVRSGHGSGKKSFFQAVVTVFSLSILGLSGCGQNTPSGAANNLNFSTGMAMYASSTPANSFVAVTDYGIHEILLYPASDLTANAANIANQISPVATVSNTSFQGPSGVFIYPHATLSSLPYQSLVKPIPACGTTITKTLIVTDAVANSISIFCNFSYTAPAQNPTITIQGSNTSLNSPEGVTVATVPKSGQTSVSAPTIFVTNLAGSNVLAFDTSTMTQAGNYNIAPTGGINPGTNGTPGAPQSLPTGLNAPAGIFFSNSTNTLVVANTGAGTVNIYPDGAQYDRTFSNDPPALFYAGGNTYISTPTGVWVNNNTLYVADNSGNVLVWDNFLTSAGDYNPTQRINGPNTYLATPYALTFDSIHQDLFVFQQSGDQILGYNTQIPYSGNTPPTYQVTLINPTLK